MSLYYWWNQSWTRWSLSMSQSRLSLIGSGSRLLDRHHQCRSMHQHRSGMHHLCRERCRCRRQYLHCRLFRRHRNPWFQKHQVGTHRMYRLRRLRHRLHLERYMTSLRQYLLECLMHLMDRWIHHSWLLHQRQSIHHRRHRYRRCYRYRLHRYLYPQ